MSWRLSLRGASFRGVAFNYDSADKATGRRVALHEYPFRDLPLAEDLGRSARRYPLRAYVIGDDYVERAEQLVAACEEAGPGTLVHPLLGERQVACLSCRRAETRERGRIATFDLEFVEAGENQQPGSRAETRVLARLAAAAAASAAVAAFARAFAVNGWPEQVAAQAAAGLSDLAASLAGLRQLSGTLSPATAAGLALGAALARELGGLADLAGALVRRADLGERLAAGFALFRQAAASPLGACRALAELPALWPAPAAAAGLSPSRRRAAANDQAFARLARRLAAVERARATADLSFASYQEAAAWRDALAGELDLLATEAGDLDGDREAEDRVWRAFTDLHAAVVRDLTERGASLARVVSWRLGASLPALALAWRWYAEPARAADLVGRNAALHPLFLPPEGERLSR